MCDCTTMKACEFHNISFTDSTGKTHLGNGLILNEKGHISVDPKNRWTVFPANYTKDDGSEAIDGMITSSRIFPSFFKMEY